MSTTSTTIRGRLPRYPWDSWLRRRRVRIVHGRDYFCMPHSMSVQIRNAAARRQLRVGVAIFEDGTILITRKD